MGMYYLGPVDGHDIGKLETVIRWARELRKPVLVHVVTKKGKGYKYAHDYAGHFAEQEFLPESLSGTKFYEPDTQNAAEAKIAERMAQLWKDKYK